MGMIFGSDYEDQEQYGGSGWSISSRKDPRWNSSGRSGYSLGSGVSEVDREVERLKRIYGEPPDDLEFGVVKD